MPKYALLLQLRICAINGVLQQSDVLDMSLKKCVIIMFILLIIITNISV